VIATVDNAALQIVFRLGVDFAGVYPVAECILAVVFARSTGGLIGYLDYAPCLVERVVFAKVVHIGKNVRSIHSRELFIFQIDEPDLLIAG